MIRTMMAYTWANCCQFGRRLKRRKSSQPPVPSPLPPVLRIPHIVDEFVAALSDRETRLPQRLRRRLRLCLHHEQTSFRIFRSTQAWKDLPFAPGGNGLTREMQQRGQDIN